MKSLKVNVIASYSETLVLATNAIPTAYPPLNRNNFDSQNSNSDATNASFIVLFLKKNDNKTNVIDAAENNMFFHSKTGSGSEKQPHLLVYSSRKKNPMTSSPSKI